MTRAKETAEIIAKHLPGVEMAKADPMLNEAL
jgi:broad specificity phosphatase PhoE